MEWTVEIAKQFAQAAHSGQTDKNGEDYFAEHITSVWESVRDAGGSAAEQIVALMHDIIEDTAVSPADLMSAGFPLEWLKDVVALTKRSNEPNMAYYERVKARPRAHSVKMHDVAHNADPDRLAKIADPTTRDRLTRKYAIAKVALGM